MDLVLIIITGLPMTLLVTGASFAIGMVGAVPLLLGLRSRFVVVRLVFRLVVDLLRGIPVIVWLFLIYFGISIGAVRLNSLTAAIIGLGVVSTAYLAEIYRGGFQALDRGQFEAADALGLDRRVSFMNVIAPQVLRITSPSIATYLIGLLKDSSIASTIGVVDLVFQANGYAQQNPGTAGLLPFIIVAIIYILLSIPLAILARRLDRRMRMAV